MRRPPRTPQGGQAVMVCGKSPLENAATARMPRALCTGAGRRSSPRLGIARSVLAGFFDRVQPFLAEQRVLQPILAGQGEFSRDAIHSPGSGATDAAVPRARRVPGIAPSVSAGVFDCVQPFATEQVGLQPFLAEQRAPSNERRATSASAVRDRRTRYRTRTASAPASAAKRTPATTPKPSPSSSTSRGLSSDTVIPLERR